MAVTRVTTERPEDLDEKWPIVRIETGENGGVVYRRKPSENNGSPRQPESCSFDAVTDGYTCWEDGGGSMTPYSNRGKVTHYQKLIWDNWYRSGDPKTYYEVNYINIWWTRSSTEENWDAKNVCF
jgi:hypothetical protein